MPSFPAFRHLTAPLLCAFTASAHGAAPFESDSPWMLGDWNGSRSELAAQGGIHRHCVATAARPRAAR